VWGGKGLGSPGKKLREDPSYKSSESIASAYTVAANEGGAMKECGADKNEL
jgi:hypothetical protein